MAVAADGLSTPSAPGFVAVWRRECARLWGDRRSRLLLFTLPLLGWLLLLWLFWPRMPRDLPIIVHDADGSALSRQLVRYVDATPTARVAAMAVSQDEARDWMLRGKAYALLSIPQGMQASVLAGTPHPVQLFYNTQWLSAGNAIARDVRQAGGTVSLQLAAGKRVLHGQNPRLALAQAYPIATQLHPLFNPSLDYARYLGLAMVMALLHIFVVVAAADACGRELRDSTAGQWFDAAGGSVMAALLGKLAPLALWFSVLGATVLLASLAWLGVQVVGSVAWLLLGWCALVLACLGLGAFLVGCTGNLRMATSVASLIISPALAFSGLTFPAWSMPTAIALWSALLPLTHYLSLHVQQVSMGAPMSQALWQVLALVPFALLPFLLLPRWRTLLSQPERWGRA